MKGADKVFVDLMNRQTMKVCTEGQENSDIYGGLQQFCVGALMACRRLPESVH